MSRIRSIFPTQWTDEEFVQCSPLARLLAIALRNECDDQGIFEWKPLTLKMKLLPADDVNVAELLAELEGAQQIMRFEAYGKSYGAVRNFCKFQRPKKPKQIHPSTELVRNWVGTDGEISPQREEGGGKMEEESPPPPPRRGGYRFEGKVVRLKADDYDRWKRAYGGIADFDAALTAADDWIIGQDPATQKRWFNVISPMLAKKHEAAKKAPPPRSHDPPDLPPRNSPEAQAKIDQWKAAQAAKQEAELDALRAKRKAELGL